MRKNIRFFWLIVLIFFLTGCSGYRRAHFPGHPIKSDEFYEINEVTKKHQIKLGSAVRATLISGEIYEGELVVIGTDYVEISSPDNGGEIYRLSSSEVSSLEHYTKARTWSILGVGAGVVVVGAAVYVITFGLVLKSAFESDN